MNGFFLKLLVFFIIQFSFYSVEGQSLCDDNRFLKGDFSLSSESLCISETLNIMDKSGANNIKYVYDYNGESLDDVIRFGTGDKIFVFPDIGRPKVYTVLQVGEKNNKTTIACKNVNVRSNNTPIYSYSICESTLDLNIPIDELNTFDSYLLELGNGQNFSILSKDLPFEKRLNIPLPFSYKISGSFLDNKQNCTNNSAYQTISTQGLITNRPFYPNIKTLELKDLNTAKIEYTGPFSNDPLLVTGLFFYEKDKPNTSVEILKSITTGSYQFKIPDSTKSYCFLAKRNTACGSLIEESAEICTHPIQKAEFNPRLFEIGLLWDSYPLKYKGVIFSPFQFFLVLGYSYFTSQRIKIIENNTIENTFNIGSTTSLYSFKVNDCKKKYCFQIEQTVSGTDNYIQYFGKSISNKVCVDQSKVTAPSINSYKVTTESLNKIKIFDDFSWPIEKEKWFLYKSIDGIYQKIDSLNYLESEFLDKSIVKKSESYKIGYLDKCNSISELSDSVNSIFLKNIDYDKLIWTSINPFSKNPIDEYIIYSFDEQLKKFKEYEFLPNTATNTKLDLFSFEKKALFYIQALNYGGDSVQISKSNIIEIPILPQIYIPSAFTPNNDGINDSLEIKGKTSQIIKFNMKIFNRYGEQVFEINDVNKKWDGIYKGKVVNQGTYNYSIFYETEDLQTKKRTGSVEVLR